MWVQATRYSYLGLFFGCSIFIGYAGGAWLDRRLHTTPWLMTVGVLFGIATGFVELLRVSLSYRREQRKLEKKP
jgi:F0F1-type ATP synthase assembly protein I